MADSMQLLRLLEPVVRPDGYGQSQTARPETLPLEARSFESLLDQAARASQDASQAGDVEAADGVSAKSPGPLAQLDQVDNVSLRALMGGRS